MTNLPLLRRHATGDRLHRRPADDREDPGAIAFPAISTGVYGYPRREAAQIATGEVAAFLENPSPLREVIFCVFDDDTHAIYQALLS
jgi:O-acetyl-ADP-ribose deacetylase (regulator of RNase III)